MTEGIRMESVFSNAADLISDDGENPEYDRGVVEMVCWLTGLDTEHKPQVLAYLRSVKRYEAEKAAIEATIYRANN